MCSVIHVSMDVSVELSMTFELLPQAICKDKAIKGALLHVHWSETSQTPVKTKRVLFYFVKQGTQKDTKLVLKKKTKISLNYFKEHTTSCWKSERCARQLLSSRILRERSSWWMMGGSALCRKLRPATTCRSIDTIISLSSITCRKSRQLKAYSYQISMSSITGGDNVIVHK